MNAEAGAFSCKIAVGKKLFGVALNDGNGARAVGQLSYHSNISAQISSAAIFVGAGKTAYNARSIINKALNVRLTGNARVRVRSPPIGVYETAGGVAIALVFALVRDGFVGAFCVNASAARFQCFAG